MGSHCKRETTAVAEAAARNRLTAHSQPTHRNTHTHTITHLSDSRRTLTHVNSIETPAQNHHSSMTSTTTIATTQPHCFLTSCSAKHQQSSHTSQRTTEKCSPLLMREYGITLRPRRGLGGRKHRRLCRRALLLLPLSAPFSSQSCNAIKVFPLHIYVVRLTFKIAISCPESLWPVLRLHSPVVVRWEQ